MNYIFSSCSTEGTKDLLYVQSYLCLSTALLLSKLQICKLTASVLIGTIGAVLLAVAEQTTLNAVAIAAGQEAVLAEWLVCVQQRLHTALLVLALAVLNRLLPVAGLLLNIEVQTSGAANSLQTLQIKREHKRKPYNLVYDVARERKREREGKSRRVAVMLTDDVHWMTSRQLSPSPATRRNHSPASLSLHSSFSKDSSFLGSSVED